VYWYCSGTAILPNIEQGDSAQANSASYFQRLVGSLIITLIADNEPILPISDNDAVLHTSEDFSVSLSILYLA